MPPKTGAKKVRAAHAPRTTALTVGVNRHSASAVFHKSGRWAIKDKKSKVTPKKAVAAAAPAGLYPADDVKRHLTNRRRSHGAALRKSITPGTVLILLAGRYRGKRVVFLKQLESGLLLVSGPHKVNGVPLRRVNQAYVIATSTKVDLSKVTVDAKFNDAYFKKVESEEKKGEDAFMAQGEKKKSELPAARKADQKAVDAQLLAAIKATPLLKQYLNARFSLTKRQAPHRMSF